MRVLDDESKQEKKQYTVMKDSSRNGLWTAAAGGGKQKQNDVEVFARGEKLLGHKISIAGDKETESSAAWIPHYI